MSSETTAAHASPHRIALQFSGHLRHRCVFGPVLLHARACRALFAKCDIFVHTWTELEPRTPHWRRGPRHPPNVSSASCVRSLQQTVTPVAVRVEEQAAAPDAAALAPDGTQFSPKDIGKEHYYYGPEREFGWRMNVHGMTQVSKLRAQNEAREGPYDLAVRLRPDDVWRFGDAQQQVRPFWACLASLLPRPNASSTRRHFRPSTDGPPPSAASLSTPAAASKRSASGRGVGSPITAGHELGVRSRKEVVLERPGGHGAISLPVFMLTLSACSGTGLSVTASDNCFFGPPSVLDAVFRVFETRYAAVYAKTSSSRLPHSRPELQLTVAAKLAGVGLADPCSPRHHDAAGAYPPLAGAENDQYRY